MTTTDNTDANDPCDYNAVDQGTPSAAWLAADCDGDGNPNGTDSNPLVAIAIDDAFTAPYGTGTSYNILTVMTSLLMMVTQLQELAVQQLV
ncbi:MAG: hypothetical protein IPN46_20170 [Saprospiraceae bacterium]|nr:hypothetical protein [Saprospiraceae bacterium]